MLFKSIGCGACEGNVPDLSGQPRSGAVRSVPYPSRSFMDTAPTDQLSGASSEVPQRASGVRAFFWNLWSTTKAFLVSLAIVVPVRAYVAQPFFVRGESMVPAFADGEYLIIDEFSYRTGLRPLQRGDVVVFRYPLDPSQYYIKRVVGLPHETVRVSSGALTLVNREFPHGVVLDESSYLPVTERTDGTASVRLKDDEVFVLGDNRDHSSDSRAWGPLSQDLVTGRAWVRAFPFTRVGMITAPWYGLLTEASSTSSGP